MFLKPVDKDKSTDAHQALKAAPPRMLTQQVAYVRFKYQAPAFGYQNRISIDAEHRLIRNWLATDAAAYEGVRLREGLLDKTNTSKNVWADTAYRSPLTRHAARQRADERL